MKVKEIKKILTVNKYLDIMRPYLIMCGFFCILFIEYMLHNKTLTDFTNLFSPWNFEKNDEMIKTYFK